MAEVDTRGCLGKVDGRYPHWVAPYDDDAEGVERFSVIYYQTDGVYAPPGPAIFTRSRDV